MLSDNLRFLRLQHNMSQDFIASYLGKKSFTTVQKWESGVTEPSLRDTAKLSNLFGVSIDDLFNKNLSIDKTELPEPSDYFNYSYIPRGVAAGALEEIEGLYSFQSLSVPDVVLGKYARDKNIVLMHVNGESMNNVISNGALVAVKTNVELSSISDNDIVIVTNSREYTLKRFYNDQDNKRFILRPDSTDHSFLPIVIPYEDSMDFKLIGKVVIYSVTL